VPLGRGDDRRRLAAAVSQMVELSSSSLFFNLFGSPRVVSCSKTGGASVTPDTRMPRQPRSSAPASHTPHFCEIPAHHTLVVELRRLGGKTVCGRQLIGACPVLSRGKVCFNLGEADFRHAPPATEDRKRRLCCVLRRRAPPRAAAPPVNRQHTVLITRGRGRGRESGGCAWHTKRGSLCDFCRTCGAAALHYLAPCRARAR
jgi:hypothetical protein